MARPMRFLLQALVIGTFGPFVACSDRQPTNPGNPDAQFVISEPVTRKEAARAVEPARSLAATAAGADVWVSLPPGAVPGGHAAVIRNLATGLTITAPITSGGFDPVAITASVGDELAIEVNGAAGILVSNRLRVPERRPPMVVRTNPPRGKVDVPLNSRITVVFSEPVDRATVTMTTVQLLTGGAVIRGTVQLDAQGLTADFIPLSELAPGTPHDLHVAAGIRDLSGDPLEAGTTVTFTTLPLQSATTEYIYLADADGSGPTRLARGQWPAWSPDGAKIAFHRDGAVYVIDANGTDETQLADGRSEPWLSDGTASWSPDGSRIVYTSQEGINVMNADGSSVRTLIRHDFRDDTYEPWDMGVGKPAWSPDGASIAFEHLGDGDIQPSQIFVMNADGTEPRRLTEGATGNARFAESAPAWSPDGSKVVFWSWVYDRGGIVSIDRPGAAQRAVQWLVAAPFHARPAWVPDGSRISFDAHPSSPARSEVWTVSVGGGGAMLLVADAEHAAWSPDGTRIAFVRRGP